MSCYIACSRPDWPLADRIDECVAVGHSDVTFLRSAGYPIHYQTVRSQILDCRHVIAIVTADFIRHDLHLYELSYALDLGKRATVVRHPSVELPSPFPARLGSLEWHQDPDILAQTVYRNIQDEGRGDPRSVCYANLLNVFHRRVIKK